MKLELKHLAPYLPYELYIAEAVPRFDDRSKELIVHFDRGKMLSYLGVVRPYIVWNCVYQHSGHSFIRETFLDELGKSIKPILRPLSDLTKEITHNWEIFVPIIELLKRFSLFNIDDCNFETQYIEEQNLWYVNAEKDRVIDSLCFDGNSIEKMYGDGTVFEPVNPHYEGMQMLFSWHFDVFGLIEKGLAVDYNSLKGH